MGEEGAAARKRHQAEELMRQHRTRLLRVARGQTRGSGVDAEDLVQETLERALKSPEWAACPSEAERDAWLGRVLINRFFDFLRSRGTEVRVLPQLGVLHQQAYPGGDDGASLWSRLSDEDFHAAVEQLAPNYRATVKLFVQGHSYKQISRELGLTMGTVGTCLFQARRRLRELLRAEGA